MRSICSVLTGAPPNLLLAQSCGRTATPSFTSLVPRFLKASFGQACFWVLRDRGRKAHSLGQGPAFSFLMLGSPGTRERRHVGGLAAHHALSFPSGLAWVAGWVLAWTGHLRAWAQSSQAVGKGGAGGDNRAGALSVSPITEGWAGPAFSVCVCVRTCMRACTHMHARGRQGWGLVLCT